MPRFAALLVLMGLALAQVPVTITYYHAVPGQTDSTPDIAACGPISMAPLWPGDYVIALSRDLFRRELCGAHILLRWDGGIITGVVWDTMNKRFYRYVDILVPNGQRWAPGKVKGILYWNWDGGY